MTTFNEFNLNEDILKAVSLMGFEEATPIQEQAIPVALAGEDLIGLAHTGTGKTAAFGIPLAQRLQADNHQIQALVVTPTRELAMQVAEELNRICQFVELRALPVYGGQDIGRQIRALKKKPQIIVGTPGRLLDHLRRRTIRLDQLQTVILDEADEMLNMGFIEDIEAILQETPSERQTLLFSATMPPAIQQLAKRFMKTPRMITVRSREVTVPNTDQYHMVVEERQKFDVLCRLLDTQPPDLAIVFGRTKRRVDELNEALSKRGYSAEGIHGDLSQARRDATMRQFKEGIIDILVATDVAARGLDIGGVTHVYNFDIPQDPESYVHRIGRTGRAGQSGMAITFVTPRELNHLRVIENGIKHKIPRMRIPTMKDAIEGQQRLTVDKLVSTMETEDTTYYQSMAAELLAEYDHTRLLAAALKLLTKEPDTTPVTLTAEAPQFS
ncbi:MAG: DEAD/DEAH box helicase, partial [Firmicutes bacterium]|nr:DEAD/DEAH box helicase [Bacillota bacterium]